MNISAELSTTVLWDNPHGEVATFTSIRFQERYDLEPRNVSPQLLRCALKFCVKTFSNTAVNSGILNDEPTAIAPITVDRHDRLCKIMAICRAYKGTQAPPSETAKPEMRSSGSDKSFLLNVTDFDNLQLDFVSLLYRAEWLSTYPGHVKEGFPRVPSALISELRDYHLQHTPFTPPFLKALYYGNGGNLSKTMNDLATSLTNQIRNGPNSTLIQGTLMLSTTFVHVNWPWLIYPGSLSVLAAVFLIVSIFFSRERERLVWKSSTLALLFHGLHGWDAQDLDVRDAKDMELLSKEMCARLAEDDTGRLAFRRA